MHHLSSYLWLRSFPSMSYCSYILKLLISLQVVVGMPPKNNCRSLRVG